MKSHAPVDVEIAVVGAGFAGSLAAMAMAQSGFAVALVDRARHPRFAIGESSTPTASLVLRAFAEQHRLPAIAALAKYGACKQQLPQLRCGLKRGFSYFHHEPAHQASQESPPFAETNNAHQMLVSANPSDAFGDVHWHRADVDHFLFAQAEQLVAYVRDGAEVDVKPRGENWGLTVGQGDEQETIHAEFIIDATGGADVTGQAGKATLDGWRTSTSAVFTHLELVGSWDAQLTAAARAEHPFASDHAAQHHLVDDGWIWMLRFDDRLASVGWVDRIANNNAASWGTRGPRSDIDWLGRWRRRLAPFPQLQSLLENAQLAPDCRWHRTPRIQRMARQFVGENWALLPSAAGTVDPLHSTGIAHSLCGVERLVEILRGGHSRQEKLRRYEHRLRTELKWIDTLVSAAYDHLSDFRMFSAATMLYFAAATTYERRRQNGERPWFLCADDESLRSRAEHWIEKSSQSTSEESADHEDRLRRLLAPWNHVGLCNPQAKNMYRYEVVDEGG